MSNLQTTIYVASAGTGKTTSLIAELTEIIKTTDPRKVVFTTFTNAGAREALDRVLKAFPDLDRDQFPWFRTLHSLAYRNIPHRALMSRSDYFDFGRKIGYPISGFASGRKNVAENPTANLIGDQLVSADNLTRLRLIDYPELFRTTGFRFSRKVFEEFQKAYRDYRTHIGKYDFTDMLEEFLPLSGTQFHPEVVIVDEAQDLSTLQWAIIRKMAPRLILAGDDKQAIYKFSGSDPESLIEFPGERRVLGTTYRLPEKILNYSEVIASKIGRRQAYTVVPSGPGGNVHKLSLLHTLDLTEGTWLFLARNRKFLPFFEHRILRTGHPFISEANDTWMSAELFSALRSWELLRNDVPISGEEAQLLITSYLKSKSVVAYGFKARAAQLDPSSYYSMATLSRDHGLVAFPSFDKAFNLPRAALTSLLTLKDKNLLYQPPRIRVTTIHGAKGAEADNVVVLPDMANATWQGYALDPDTEHRVFYVSATRARKNLYLMLPISDKYYPFPSP